ncbi:MAG: hypothetical protein U0930_26245 [Pirellulales bacterium]
MTSRLSGTLERGELAIDIHDWMVSESTHLESWIVFSALKRAEQRYLPGSSPGPQERSVLTIFAALSII